MFRSAAQKDPKILTWRVEVRSAGTSARSGDAATALAVRVMKRRGIDTSAHRSTRLSREAAEWADVILTMTKTHKQTVVQNAPMVGARTFTIAEYAGADGEIEDPLIEGTEEAYERCSDHLSSLMPRVLMRVPVA